MMQSADVVERLEVFGHVIFSALSRDADEPVKERYFVLEFWAVSFPLDGGTLLLIVGITFTVLLALSAVLFAYYGALWFQAYMSGADVSLRSLVGMSFRRVNPQLIVTAKIMGYQAGLNIDRREGMSTARLEAHVLAGGDVMQVLRAIIAAHRAGIDLDFDRAAAIDLAGRDIFDAVRTSVSPKVIDCPEAYQGSQAKLSAFAKNGIELRVRARVTVRTNLNQLIGGATEQTIIARVGQGIVAAIGASATHMEVLETPSRISKNVLARGLDANTAFEIVSIDIADIDVGENVGARLQADQADADMRVARARAEVRRADAIAWEQEMKAKVAESRALFVLAEAQIPAALGHAFVAVQPATDAPTPATSVRRGDVWQVLFPGAGKPRIR